MCSYDSVVLLTLIPRIGRERLFFLQQRVLGGSQYSLTVIHHYRVLMVVKRESRIVYAGGEGGYGVCRMGCAPWLFFDDSSTVLAIFGTQCRIGARS